MEIVRLPVGKQPSVDSDCIRIEEQPDGRYTLSASAVCSEADENDSVSVAGTYLFATLEEAEANGLAWAESVGVQRLFVSTGTQARPLEITEIDRPL